MIPRLYSESETDFFSNGICALSESVSATVTEEANSIFTLELEYPIHGRWFSEIKRSRLIKALPNVGDEEHIFRIKEIVKSTNPKTVRIYASTKSEDLNGHIIKEFERRDTAANVVLSSLPAAIYPPTNYLFHTDITTKVSPYWFMRNVTNSILGSEGSLVDLLGGGELKRNNDSLYLYRRRGRDNVTRVTPRKNLRGLEITESTKGLITRIQPYMILQDPETSEDIVVIGDVVSSPLANNYPNQNVVPMDFSGYELENKTQLNQRAASYFTSMNPGCDKPNVTLNVDLINIYDSAEYSKFKDFETVKLFDTVTVYVPRYDVDVLVKIVSVTFDVLREKVIQITAGQPSSTFVQDLNKTYNDALSNVGNTLKKEISTAQLSADGKNMIFYGSGQPKATRIGDTWFKPNGMETEMLIWTGSGWGNPFLGGDNIADEAITGTKIANATIGSAKIINVDANKITAKTLSAITTNTGDLNVTGWLDFSTENRGLRGSYDFGDTYGGAYDARWFDGTFRLSHRHFVFTGNNYEVNPDSTKGRHLGYSESFQGQDYLKFRTWNYNGGTMYGRIDITSTYINMSSSYDTTNINLNATNGDSYFRGDMSIRGDVNIASDKSLFAYNIAPPSSASNIYFNGWRTELADFRIGLDGVGKVIQSLAVYNRTYSSAANMFVTDAGTIGRSVSARKYKLLIEDSELLDKAKNFLQIKPKNWYDKAEVESVAKALNQYEDIELSAQAVRHHGFIADELDEIGLNEVVQYGIDGQVEGLAYDRLTIYYHELIKDLYRRIEVLENGQTNSDY